MINNKISELKNIFENSNTNSNDNQYLKIRRKTLLFFKANVAFTRSEIYGKVIQKIKTDNIQLQDISSLTLESLNIQSNADGLDRMSGYLSEIKNAILNNNAQMLGKDYRNGMRKLINTLHKHVSPNSPYNSFKSNLLNTIEYKKNKKDIKDCGFSQSTVTKHYISANNQTITYVKKTNPSNGKDAVNAALASKCLEKVVGDTSIKLANGDESTLKVLNIQAYAGSNNIKQIQELMNNGEILSHKPQGLANISDYKQSVMLGTVFDFFKLADNIAYNIRPTKNTKGQLEYVVFDMDDAFLPTQADDKKHVAPEGIFFDLTPGYVNMFRNNIFDFLDFALQNNPANNSINKFLLKRDNVKLEDFIYGMKQGLIKIQETLNQDEFEELINLVISNEKLGKFTNDLNDYKNKLQEIFISRLQNLKHCIAALDKIGSYFSLNENIQSLMENSEFKNNLKNKLGALVKDEINNSDPFKNKNLEKYYERTTHTKTFSGKNGIKRHTEAVLNNFNEYYKDNCKVNNYFDPLFIEKLLKLHDIGKGIDSNTSKQHENTIKVINENAENIGLSNQEFQIITTIIEHEPIGTLFKSYNESSIPIKDLNYSNAAEQLKKAFLTIKQYEPNLTEKQFFNLICMYYSCDAATYPFIVKQGVFDKKLKFQGNYSTIIDNLYAIWTVPQK